MSEIPERPGIYRIRITRGERPSKFYVGQTSNLFRRWREHWTALIRGGHDNVALQNAWNLHGQSSFSFEVLHTTDDLSDLTRCEQFYVDWHPRSLLYNIRIECVDTNRGMIVSDETRKRISMAQIGRKRSPESVARSAAGLRGRKMSEEQRLALVAANLGRKASEETRRKLRESHLGYVMPEEQRAKIAAKSRLHRHTEESRRKMSEYRTGMKWTPEFRERVMAGRRAAAETPHYEMFFAGNESDLICLPRDGESHAEYPTPTLPFGPWIFPLTMFPAFGLWAK